MQTANVLTTLPDRSTAAYACLISLENTKAPVPMVPAAAAAYFAAFNGRVFPLFPPPLPDLPPETLVRDGWVE
jgi:hypothetical protein